MIHLYSLAADSSIDLDQRYAIARRMNLMRRYHKLKGDETMIELTKSEARIYSLLLQGLRSTHEIVERLGLGRTHINWVIKKLEHKGLVTIQGEGGNRVLRAYHQKYYLVGRKSKDKVRYSVVKKLIRNYGADNVRYVSLRLDAPEGELAAKIGVKPRDVAKIKMVLGA